MTDYEEQMPRQIVELDGHDLSFRIPNEMTEWRVAHLVDVEPITVAWIFSFAPGDVFVDIGANIGVFSVIAATCRQAKVFAFEPQAQSYALLCRNIEDNHLGDQVTAWPAALTDKTGFDVLHVMRSFAGHAHHSYGDAVNFNLHPQEFPARQGSVGTTLDALVADNVIPVPAHVKIDVDGLEHRVIAGAASTLSGSNVKSVLIEINHHLAEHMALIAQMEDWGFSHDPVLTERAKRTEGIHAGMGEIVFRRTS